MSALRDVVSDVDVIATTEYLEVLPTGTAEWVIHNIWHEGGITLRFYKDATDYVDVSFTGAGLLAYYSIHVTATIWLRIINDEATDKRIGYDGVITKV